MAPAAVCSSRPQEEALRAKVAMAVERRRACAWKVLEEDGDGLAAQRSNTCRWRATLELDGRVDDVADLPGCEVGQPQEVLLWR
jgi:hypothetical protein